MRRLFLATALAAAALCVPAAPPPAPPPALRAGWSHAEINVTGANGKPHTLVFDRGRIQAVGSFSLTLREQDGSLVTIQVAPRATVRLNGRNVPFFRLRPGLVATTRGTDGKPANLVKATTPPRKAVKQTA